mmetsp:Transcript_6810/g.11695  ORF Transcript_6810/g.11695 Transcript_6810/m.11695 type:complete len:185 (-) Transcript_6810:543-1097(-)|eukprot:CAMPEP_0196658420 /NCGR_PEP_ID=MMETSP1086-20130531/29570_1 /TAXON_ID=77921 /ORGANISM="Cyanoptyche  gloeocystis , Strain SAG4.97" /LENGTH=184 /DNA_ID=CAMNT_0041991983 /DNA_START=81 /DNA_END=635 /DNA_ORIENTATION=-
MPFVSSPSLSIFRQQPICLFAVPLATCEAQSVKRNSKPGLFVGNSRRFSLRNVQRFQLRSVPRANDTAVFIAASTELDIRPEDINPERLTKLINDEEFVQLLNTLCADVVKTVRSKDASNTRALIEAVGELAEMYVDEGWSTGDLSLFFEALQAVLETKKFAKADELNMFFRGLYDNLIDQLNE